MENEQSIMLFNNENFGEVRALVIDGVPWFFGRDVALVLGYGNGNPRSKALTNALKDHIDEEDKMYLSYRELKKTQNGDLRNISHYGARLINESGVYSLICSSKLPSAKQFKRWITSEVLPSIRKYGAYASDFALEMILESPELGARLFTKLKHERDEISQKVTVKPNSD